MRRGTDLGAEGFGAGAICKSGSAEAVSNMIVVFQWHDFRGTILEQCRVIGGQPSPFAFRVAA